MSKASRVVQSGHPVLVSDEQRGAIVVRVDQLDTQTTELSTLVRGVVGAGGDIYLFMHLFNNSHIN